jgi:hypothetical protein
MKQSITLAEALKTGKLNEFVDQAEANGVGPISRSDFDEILGKVTAPRPEDQTSRSPARGGSRGK